MGLDADWLRRASAFAFLVVAFVVAACSIRGGSVDLSSSPVPTADSGASPAAPQPVKVALLLPLTSTSQTEAVANAMKQAAELAVFELNNPNLQLIIKDDAGTSEGAQKAAEEAIQEGAELILGPLFAASVRAVGPVAQQAGRPVLAFSNDGQVAGNGVYLLGFMPQQEVRRVANYALAQAIGDSRPSFPKMHTGKSWKQLSGKPSLLVAAPSWRSSATRQPPTPWSHLRSALLRLFGKRTKPGSPSTRCSCPETRKRCLDLALCCPTPISIRAA